MVKITCKGSSFIDIDNLVEFQGELKKRTKKDLELIKKSIEKYGFSFPFFVWKHEDENKVLDGHGRLLALKEMRKDGEEIPHLPIVEIFAESVEEAKNKLLRLNSQFGSLSNESVMTFASGMEIDLDDLALPAGTLALNFEINDYSDLQNELDNLEGMEDEIIEILVPKVHAEKVREYLRNNCVNTSAGLGQGVMKLCGLL